MQLCRRPRQTLRQYHQGSIYRPTYLGTYLSEHAISQRPACETVSPQPAHSVRGVRRQSLETHSPIIENHGPPNNPRGPRGPIPQPPLPHSHTVALVREQGHARRLAGAGDGPRHPGQRAASHQRVFSRLQPPSKPRKPTSALSYTGRYHAEVFRRTTAIVPERRVNTASPSLSLKTGSSWTRTTTPRSPSRIFLGHEKTAVRQVDAVHHGLGPGRQVRRADAVVGRGHRRARALAPRRAGGGVAC